MNTIQKTISICLLLLIGLSAKAQQNNLMGGLKIGDKMPDVVMSKVLVDGKTEVLNTKNYADKLLILDFWDTSCASCIAAFPRLDSLQAKYGGKIQLVTVTFQKEEVVKAFKVKNRIAKAMKLPIAVEDKQLKILFPHRFVSHTVWINKGVVIAISKSEYVDQKLIDLVLGGQQINLPVKNDFYSYDFNKSSLMAEQASTGKKLYSMITGYQDGATSNGSKIWNVVDSVNGTVKDVYLNMQSIVRLYITLLGNIKKLEYVLKKDMILVEAANPENYDLNYLKKGMFADDWVRKHAVSYESVLPGVLDQKSRAKCMLADLDNKLGLYGRMELRPHTVWVIKKLAVAHDAAFDGSLSTEKSTKIKGENFIGTIQVDLMMRTEFADSPPLIDEAGLKEEQILEMYSYNDKESLRKMLNRNQLDLIEEIREIEVFVLSDRRR